MPPSIHLFMFSCLLLAGCVPKASEVNIPATWGKNLGTLGITPIYPPSEDLFVGDIRLYIQNPCDTGAASYQLQSIPMGSIPMADIQTAIEQYYGQRPQLPATSKQQTTVAISPSSSPSLQAQPIADARNPIFPNGDKGSPLTRFRLAAFPEFSYSDFTARGIGATIPIHAVNATAGADKQSGRQGYVSVSQVEEAMLPAPVMLRLINNYLHGPHRSDILNSANITFLKSLYEQQMIANSGCSKPGQHSSKPAYVVFITRVYYARTFDYQFAQSEAAAASLHAALTEAAAAAATSQAPSSTRSTAARSTDTAQVAADAAATALKTLNSSRPGVSTSIEAGSQGGLALRQTFDRPLAFGVGQPIVFDADDIKRSLEQ